MSLYDILMMQFPGGGLLGSPWWLIDNGGGPSIAHWDVVALGRSEPSPAEIAAWKDEAEAWEAEEQVRKEHAAKITKIKAALDEIDRKSSRPLRAVAAGTAADDDRSALAALESQAVVLRTELAALTGGPQ